MIINVSVANDPVVTTLSKMTKFKPIISQSTSKSSMLFPSLKSSCLLLKVDSLEINQKVISHCDQFLRLNTNPFILFSPAEGCQGDGSDVLFAASRLAIALEDPSLDKVPAVIPVMSEELAVKSILFMVNSPKGKSMKNES